MHRPYPVWEPGAVYWSACEAPTAWRRIASGSAEPCTAPRVSCDVASTRRAALGTHGRAVQSASLARGADRTEGADGRDQLHRDRDHRHGQVRTRQDYGPSQAGPAAEVLERLPLPLW